MSRVWERLASCLERLAVRWSSLKTRMIGFVLLICLILVGLDARYIWDDRSRAIEKAQHDNELGPIASAERRRYR